MRWLLALVLTSTIATAQESLPVRLQKSFHGAGLDYQLYTEKDGLVVWGCMNSAIVYQVLANTDILPAVKAAGYGHLDFKAGRCGGSLWTFDLKGAELPKCDTRKKVCF